MSTSVYFYAKVEGWDEYIEINEDFCFSTRGTTTRTFYLNVAEELTGITIRSDDYFYLEAIHILKVVNQLEQINSTDTGRRKIKKALDGRYDINDFMRMWLDVKAVCVENPYCYVRFD